MSIRGQNYEMSEDNISDCFMRNLHIDISEFDYRLDEYENGLRHWSLLKLNMRHLRLLGSFSQKKNVRHPLSISTHSCQEELPSSFIFCKGTIGKYGTNVNNRYRHTFPSWLIMLRTTNIYCIEHFLNLQRRNLNIGWRKVVSFCWHIRVKIFFTKKIWDFFLDHTVKSQLEIIIIIIICSPCFYKYKVV